MGVHLAALAAIASLASTPASAETADPLDAFIRFSDPVECTPGGDLDALLRSVLIFEETGDTYRPVLSRPTVPAAYRSRVGEADLVISGRTYTATLPLAGEWQGLPLRALQINGVIESEAGFALLFAAAPEQVLRAANAAGFGLPDTGSVYREDEVLGMAIGVSSVTPGARPSIVCRAEAQAVSPPVRRCRQ